MPFTRLKLFEGNEQIVHYLQGKLVSVLTKALATRDEEIQQLNKCIERKSLDYENVVAEKNRQDEHISKLLNETEEKDSEINQLCLAVKEKDTRISGLADALEKSNVKCSELNYFQQGLLESNKSLNYSNTKLLGQLEEARRIIDNLTKEETKDKKEGGFFNRFF